MKEIGTKERGIGPETQYQVAVIDNIKGELHGTVTVDQIGGYKDGILYTVDSPNAASDGSAYLLQPGSTYLLATRYNSSEDWHTFISYPTARALISSNAAASAAALQLAAAANARVRALTAAYPHEILLQADVANGNALNSSVATSARSSN